MQCEYYALEGLSDLVGTIRKVHANFNPEIKIMGILRVMYDSRITLAQQVSAQLEEHFKEKVFKAVIPRNIRLAEAPSHGARVTQVVPSATVQDPARGHGTTAGQVVPRATTVQPAGEHCARRTQEVPLAIHLRPAGCHCARRTHVIPGATTIHPAGDHRARQV